MHLIKPSALLQLLFFISITQAIILDLDSLNTWEDEISVPLREYTMQAFDLAFVQASASSTQLSASTDGAIANLAIWLFGASGKALAKINLDGIGEVNQFFTTDKTTRDYDNNPIAYFSLDRFVDGGREDGALWDEEAGIFAGGDPAVMKQCFDGSGTQPPHFLTFNYGPRAIHDTIDICPWYIRWLSQV